MPGQRLPMRQVREVLRLKHVCGHSGHQIAVMVGLSRYTVAEYRKRCGADLWRSVGVP
jgi:biotin operon repressor